MLEKSGNGLVYKQVGSEVVFSLVDLSGKDLSAKRLFTKKKTMADNMWSVLPLEDYNLARPAEPGELGVELLVHARANGRILDHFRIAVGGSRIIDVTTTTGLLFGSEMLPTTAVNFQLRPDEIGLRQNSITSEWIDVVDQIRSRDFLVGDDPEDDDNEELLSLLDTIDDASGTNASVRWAVAVTEQQTLELVLQALPASADTLNGRLMVNYI
jgi:hypothetical protein